MKRRRTTEEFIEKAKQIHGDKYNYSKVNYSKSNEKVCIICPEHGEFWQTPCFHIQGQGCPRCGEIRRSKNKTYTTEKFINKAKSIHGSKYDYSKVDYVNAKTKVCIICPKHGEFWQVPTFHLHGYGCIKCGLENSSGSRKLTTKDFVERARKIHGDKYDYSKTIYNGMFNKVDIICHVKKRNGEEHGVFSQEPHNHLKGNGCPICRNSSLERIVEEELEKKSIKYIHHANHNLFSWLGKQHLDFYLPDYNIAIECQGEQHFKKYRFEKDNKRLEKRNKLDRIKNELCKENGVKLIYYSNVSKYTHFLGKKIINNINDLMKEIYD